MVHFDCVGVFAGLNQAHADQIAQDDDGGGGNGSRGRLCGWQRQGQRLRIQGIGVKNRFLIG